MLIYWFDIDTSELIISSLGQLPNKGDCVYLRSDMNVHKYNVEKITHVLKHHTYDTEYLINLPEIKNVFGDGARLDVISALLKSENNEYIQTFTKSKIITSEQIAEIFLKKV